MSAPKELIQSWERTTQSLRQAAALLPPNPGGARRAQFHAFLEHNELELALDELIGLGDEELPSREFWSLLRSAAEEMKLDAHVTRLTRRAADAAG